MELMKCTADWGMACQIKALGPTEARAALTCSQCKALGWFGWGWFGLLVDFCFALCDVLFGSFLSGFFALFCLVVFLLFCFLSPSICMPVCLPVYLSACLSVCLSGT